MIIKPGLMVVGTDTGVGKTWVASAIARTWTGMGHRVGVVKPVSSGGTLGSDDADRLIEAIGGFVSLNRVSPIILDEPLAPTVAARRSGVVLGRPEIERALTDVMTWWEDRADVMVIEGVGGLLCPVAEGMTVADLAIELDYPLLVVARRGLGTINHTLMTVEAALTRSLRVAGVVLNGSEPATNPVAEASNADELSRWLGAVPILADWPHQADSHRERVAPEAGGWLDLARRPRFVPAFLQHPGLVTPLA